MKLFGVCLATHNVETMVGFYTKVFGYPPVVDGPDHRFLDAQLIVFALDEAERASATRAGMIYLVGDVDAEYTRLHALGIAHDPPTDKPWGVRSFVIRDPDGNTVSFFAERR